MADDGVDGSDAAGGQRQQQEQPQPLPTQQQVLGMGFASNGGTADAAAAR